ncbi:MAG: hypothetical protein HS130_06535 [Deltaproteobacteria bacterium]|nr:hypothetical protein [Deltaproteobacteria bacterium]
MQIPHGWAGQIKSRSGLGAKAHRHGRRRRQLLQGEIGVVAISSSSARTAMPSFRPGDKVAQMVSSGPQVAIELAEASRPPHGAKQIGAPDDSLPVEQYGFHNHWRFRP